MDRHIMVAMRMIGHEVLINANDSISRVLAIEKDEDQYIIEFESDFTFKPIELTIVVDKNIKEHKIASSYIVEVEECNTEKIIYSYEVGLVKSDMIPCRARLQPKDFYRIIITLIDKIDESQSYLTAASPVIGITSKNQSDDTSKFFYLIIPILFLTGFYIYYRKKMTPSDNPSNNISIGEYEFDKNIMTLQHTGKLVELTSKESDLLFLLYSSRNNILKREDILKEVWGDEGDYVGRTLDVFISKLRKKLDLDSNLKIINIRGVGYKFVVGSQS